ncbi:MAG: hypothetical protein SCG82_00305 [Candidatus Nitrotoga sp.]|nr:hypothetical protein [Candidatus Nitrotoga sp.]MDW7604603.1 hypothetical protein [Candidatus Nitrotoga sp.]MDW7612680.1 hypothetical protein [Candidatus Nitrotoga sp.]MDW7625119.1 hypothetical protein [Candidatus Nitrotoga sp.]
MIDQAIKTGWRIVEVLFILILICLGLGIVLGPTGGGAFISSVVSNTESFLRSIPPGIFLGIFIVVGLYWTIKKKT